MRCICVTVKPHSFLIAFSFPILTSLLCLLLCTFLTGNLQVIAYLSTDLHRAMLEMFVEVHVLMPNMAIGRITRERSKYAYNQGINASQIIDYLTNHAHPVALTRTSIIPQNVSDQLLLWEAENYRVQTEEAAIVELGDISIHSLITVFSSFTNHSLTVDSLTY